ncbi:hypothetical protein [Ottowia sp.]|uniref:hypothetical protein n=1 Tax=Ottowia sp. TaxID=1898956 RepID=UPI003A8352F4
MNALTSEVKTSLKVIGANGQISLGKGYAGRQVLVEEREPGVWFVRTAIVIPENERWLHQPQSEADLQAAMQWAAKNKPQATDLDTLFGGLNDSDLPVKPARKARPQQPKVSRKPA